MNKKNKRQHYTYLKYHPKTTGELNGFVRKLIKERGPEADLNDIDVSMVSSLVDISWLFEFNGNISKWDVSNVSDLFLLLYKTKFNGDISNWEIHPECDIRLIFELSDYTNMFNNMFYFIGQPSGYLKYFYRYEK